MQSKLFMLLLGARPKGRNVEQHDIFFGIATSLQELIPEIKSFWKEAPSIHIDAWREVNTVDGYSVSVFPVDEVPDLMSASRLFFINLGGYQENKFEEQHYVMLAVSDNKASVLKRSKTTDFFKTNSFENAVSHIDDKYGIDIDDLYEIEEILPEAHKAKYKILLTPAFSQIKDEIHLGYLRLDKLK